MKRVSKQILGGIIKSGIILLLTVTVNSCENPDKKDSRAKLDDPQAIMYRMFYDGENPNDYLASKKFVGRLRQPNLEDIFGDLSSAKKTSEGNYAIGWVSHQEYLWLLQMGPEQKAKNLMSIDKEGNLSSSIDLDGDGIVDIVDIQLAGDKRFSFLNEKLGLDFFVEWLNKKNPLCKESSLSGIDLPLFNCPSSGGGGRATTPGIAGVEDVFASICAEFNNTPRAPRPGVMGHGFNPPGSEGLSHDQRWAVLRQNDDADSPIESAVLTDVFRNEDGEIVSVYRTITEHDEEGRITRVTQEQLDGGGNGQRTITDYGEDNTTERHEETFVTDPEAYVEDIQNSDPPPPDNVGPVTTNPGPVDGPFAPDGSMEQWCAATSNPYVSGAEQAAAYDPAKLRVSCDDLVRSGDGTDCVIVEWATPGDFDGVLDPPSDGNNCGPFEYPGPEGNCTYTNNMERLRGRTAEIISANLGPVIICDPLVCR